MASLSATFISTVTRRNTVIKEMLEVYASENTSRFVEIAKDIMA